MYLGFNRCFTIFIQLAVIHVINSVKTNSEACNSCCTPGVPGIPGNHGNPGLSGAQGDGEQGIKGEQGIDGEHGMKGDNGRNGSDGIPGKLGPKGPQGLPGTIGVKGEKGDNGRNGLDGNHGKFGQKGTRGKPGVKGEKGEQANATSQEKSAFTAVFKSHPGRPIGPLKYDTIFTNVGNHYNKNTGKFVCAIPGVYVFQVTSRKTNNGQFVTRIMKNGHIQVSIQMDAEGNNSASTMVVLDLVSGDQVWTQPGSSYYNEYYSDSTGWCSFSGFLLYAA